LAKGIIDTYTVSLGGGVEYYPGFALLLDRELWDVVGMAILVETMFLGHRLKSWGVPVHVKGKLFKYL